MPNGWIGIIPALADLILEALDGWLAAGKITKDQYDEAKRVYGEAKARREKATADFYAWLNDPE